MEVKEWGWRKTVGKKREKNKIKLIQTFSNTVNPVY